LIILSIYLTLIYKLKSIGRTGKEADAFRIVTNVEKLLWIWKQKFSALYMIISPLPASHPTSALTYHKHVALMLISFLHAKLSVVTHRI
jgi:hypothetical protein